MESDSEVQPVRISIQPSYGFSRIELCLAASLVLAILTKASPVSILPSASITLQVIVVPSTVLTFKTIFFEDESKVWLSRISSTLKTESLTVRTITLFSLEVIPVTCAESVTYKIPLVPLTSLLVIVKTSSPPFTFRLSNSPFLPATELNFTSESVLKY